MCYCRTGRANAHDAELADQGIAVAWLGDVRRENGIDEGILGFRYCAGSAVPGLDVRQSLIRSLGIPGRSAPPAAGPA
jgi:hypothetical protein